MCITLDLLDQACTEPLAHVSRECLQVHQDEDLAEPEESQQEDEASSVRVILILADPVEWPCKACNHIEEEAATDVVLGDLEDVSDFSARIARIEVVGEEVSHQVRNETYLHHCFKNDNTLHLRLSEAGEERSEDGRDQREDDDEDEEDSHRLRGGINDELFENCRLLRVHVCRLDLLMRLAIEGHAETDVLIIFCNLFLLRVLVQVLEKVRLRELEHTRWCIDLVLLRDHGLVALGGWRLRLVLDVDGGRPLRLPLPMLVVHFSNFKFIFIIKRYLRATARPLLPFRI